MNKFYIYLHYRKTDGKVFYVGKGSGNRAYSTDSRNSHWRAIVAKYGYYTEIIFDDLTEEESFDLEKNTILELKYFGYRLANKTHGGEGVSGYRHTKETKLKLIDNTIYTFISRYGEVFTGTRFELSTIKNVDRINLSQIFSKNRVSSALGWAVKEDNETIEDCIFRINNKKSMAKSDKTTYSFVRKDGETFVGTRFELSQKYNLDINRICELFSKRKRKTSQGWSLNIDNNEGN